MTGIQPNTAVILVSIPQAVSTVATRAETSGIVPYLWIVSIPQAVSTVATKDIGSEDEPVSYGFNTASGKHCCNAKGSKYLFYAVISFQYRKR